MPDRLQIPPGSVQQPDLGAQVRRGLGEWPNLLPLTLYLGGGGRAAATTVDGTLVNEPGASAADYLVHDPWRSAPSLGGHASQPGGMQDRRAVDDRADVACFTAAPLDAPLFLCGRVRAELWVEADQPSFDLSVVLSMVAPDGRVWNLTQGHRRASASGRVDVSLRATCATVPAGHALRVSVAGACFPAYPVNPGTGGPAHEARAEDERVITLRIGHGGSTASQISLPAVV